MTALAFDRTTEFRACTQSLYQHVLSGRLKLAPAHLKSTHQSNISSHSLVNEFLEKSKNISEKIKLTRLKLSKLKLLLEEELLPSSTEECRKLIDILNVDVIDLNKVKSQLRMYTSRLKNEFSINTQQSKHFHCIIVGIEYHLSQIVTEFRDILENYKHILIDQPHCDTNLDHNHNFCGAFDQNQNTTTFITNDNQPIVLNLDKVALSNQPKNYHRSPNIVNNSSISKIVLNAPLYPSSAVSLNNQNASFDKKLHFNHDLFIDSSTSVTMNQSPNQYQTDQSLQQVQSFVHPHQISFVDQEIRQRDAAMRRVESTIVQLGEIYQQFSTLVQEQEEMVLRIDSHTDNVEFNITSAHSQLLNYFKQISNQRGFLLKVFGVLIICFVIFAIISK